MLVSSASLDHDTVHHVIPKLSTAGRCGGAWRCWGWSVTITVTITVATATTGQAGLEDVFADTGAAPAEIDSAGIAVVALAVGGATTVAVAITVTVAVAVTVTGHGRVFFGRSIGRVLSIVPATARVQYGGYRQHKLESLAAHWLLPFPLVWLEMPRTDAPFSAAICTPLRGECASNAP